MASPIILLADNDSDFLRVRAEYLEVSGYRVLRAATLEQARRVLSEAHLNLAVFDMRLVDDDDEKDISGIALAQDPSFRTIPKIILTGRPEYQYVRAALGKGPDGFPAAVGFVDKKEEREVLLQTIQQALTQYVHLNWLLQFQWPVTRTLSLPILAHLIDPTRATDRLAGDTHELEDLFRELFYDYDHITIVQMLWQAEGRVALEVAAHTRQEERQMVVVCGRSAVIKTQTADGVIVFKTPRSVDATRVLTAETQHFAACATNDAGLSGEPLQSLAVFYRERPDRAVKTVLETLFQSTLAGRYAHHQSLATNVDWLQLYGEPFGFDRARLTAEHFARAVRTVIDEALVRSLAEISLTPDRMSIRFPHGRTVQCPNPASMLFQDEPWTATRVVCGVALVGLDVETILVDRSGYVWPSDLTMLATAPISHDFVALEAAIRFKLVEVDNLQTVFDFEKRLASARSLAEPIAPEDVAVEHRKALAAITTVRRLASELSGDGIGAYTIGLLIRAVTGFGAYDFDRKLSRSDTRRWLHQLFCAGLASQRLLDLKLSGVPVEAPSGVRQGLRLDPDSREVWVAGQKVALSPTEFELLTFLHAHPGMLCKRVDIAHEVFKVAGDISDDDEQLINTTMGRLRKKIEIDVTGPRYIETVRGLGYRLWSSDTPNV